MFHGVLNESILKRAQEMGIVQVKLINFREYATDKHRTVDDYPYGGGAGMVLKPEPIFRAVDHIKETAVAKPRINTLLGGSMSSRLFQNVREKRGLAYAVFSGLSAYRDAGSFTIYAGCSNEAVGEVIDLCVDELRAVKSAPVPEAELRRSKDHLKGSLMLSLENTASRMSHLARQEIYFDRQFGLDETLVGIERVTDGDVQRVAQDLFRNGSLAATVLGNVNGLQIPVERLDLQ